MIVTFLIILLTFYCIHMMLIQPEDINPFHQQGNITSIFCDDIVLWKYSWAISLFILGVIIGHNFKFIILVYSKFRGTRLKSIIPIMKRQKENRPTFILHQHIEVILK